MQHTLGATPITHPAADNGNAINAFLATKLRIPEHPATHSDNIRPPIPGYPATCDALP